MTLGDHLKKRRRELGLLQREAAAQMGILTETYLNWEKDHTEPVAAQFRPVAAFLGYNPGPTPRTLAERVQAKRRELGVTFSQVARDLGWDEGTLTRYLRGIWQMPPARAAELEKLLSAEAGDLSAICLGPRRLRGKSN